MDRDAGCLAGAVGTDKEILTVGSSAFYETLV